MEDQFNIPVKVEVDESAINNQLGKVGTFLLSHGFNMLFGKRGLIRPEYETSFWLGQYYITFKID